MKKSILRKQWENTKYKQLKYSNRGKREPLLIDKATDDERIANIQERFKDLSETLESMYILYLKKEDLYGDALLAFIGNSIIRCWPWKDFWFTSVEAMKLINKPVYGMYTSDMKKIFDITERPKEIKLEHWTPISYFRDLFRIGKGNGLVLTANNFYDELLDNYRVVRITKKEDDLLTSHGYRSKRPKEAYDLLGIDIFEKNLWNQMYGKYD